MILRLNRALLVAFHAPIVVLLLVTLYSVLRSLFRLGLARSLSIFLHIHLFYSLLRFRPNRTDPFVLSCVISKCPFIIIRRRLHPYFIRPVRATKS